ncbi:Hpt domain-containing protein [Saccharobesus litoralis]|uniref:Hpt domain-containing protein n=1 Tax=Saccharobesus litoralis TaxID=2172099 RepID=A0A2S0VW60_9ALTE|nr:Hpt domain-containing protein [Saccharobesus litoralis]AWB68412.1 Hpt domain-containing protein [Saccharobesus litoralis]
MAQSDSVYNKSILVDLIGDDQALIRSYQNQFLQQCIASTKTFAKAFNAKDFAELKAIAHQLKTSAKALGAVQCAERLQAIEEAALTHDLTTVRSLLQQLTSDIKAVKGAFYESE